MPFESMVELYYKNRVCFEYMIPNLTMLYLVFRDGRTEIINNLFKQKYGIMPYIDTIEDLK